MPPLPLDADPDAGFSIIEFVGRRAVPRTMDLSLAVESINAGVAKPIHLHQRTTALLQKSSSAPPIPIPGQSAVQQNSQKLS